MDRLTQLIERTGAVIDLITAVVFLAIMIRVFRWVDENLILVGVQ